MKNSTLFRLAVLVLLGIAIAGMGRSADSPKPAFTAQQILVDGVSVVRLADSARGIEISILPSLGNIASEMKIHGKNILVFPDVKLSDFQKRPMQTGIPFLAPWANRLDVDGFWANGKNTILTQLLAIIARTGDYPFTDCWAPPRYGMSRISVQTNNPRM